MSDKQKKLILAAVLFVIAGAIIIWQLSGDSRPGAIKGTGEPAADAPPPDDTVPSGPRSPSMSGGGRAISTPPGGG